MDRLHEMAVLVAVAEAESFSAAARKLGLSAPAVTRAVAELEARLQIKLLARTTRHVRTTEAGARYVEDARRILNDVDEADEAAAGINAEPRGQLAITTPVLFGKLFVMPGVVEYLQRYPSMDVSVLLIDRVVNLLEEGLDVGIRIGELPDSRLKALPAGQVRRVLCAAPNYLKRHGLPQHPKELTGHCLIDASSVSPVMEWKFREQNNTVAVRIKPRLLVNNNGAAIAATVQGFGICQLMSYQVAEHLNNGQLQTLLTDYEQKPLPIHVLHREGRYASAKVRSFVDLISQRLRANAALAE